ncbi:ABC transporter permease subunit [Paenibacillus sp. P26]|nr:ABC transporter permease subunit [Paenibacillus sp. P26]
MMASIRTGLRSETAALVALCLLLIFFILTLLAPWIAPHDPVQVNLALKLKPPTPDYPLGTDHLGRCILSRLLYGARASLGFASLIFICSLGIGLVIGTLAGYKGGIADQVLMRFCEAVMSFPHLVLILGLVGIFGPGLTQVILAMLLVQWVYYARMFRGMVLSLKEQNFVTAARISGSSQWKIIRTHIIPNILPPSP